MNQLPQPSAIFSRLGFWVPGLAFFAAALACYFPALFGERIWDDHALLGWNPFVRSPWLIWDAFWQPLYPSATADYFRPLQSLSYLADYLVWGENHFGYHLSNVLLHAASGVMLVSVLRRILPRVWPAEQTVALDWAVGFVGMLWLVHPIHHAAIGYVAGRADSLAALCALTGWLLYENAILSEPRWRRWIGLGGAALFALLALYAKEIGAAWLTVFLFYRLVFAKEEGWRQRALTAGAVLMLLASWDWHRGQVLGNHPGERPSALPVSERLPLMLQALGDYARLFLWPENLHMERRLSGADWNARQSGASSTRLMVYGTIAVLCWLAICLGKRGWRRLGLFSAGWFLIGFLPISNLFPLVAQVAEHWMYLPSIAVLLPIGALFAMAFRFRPRIAACGAACVLMTLGLRTHEQSRYWVGEEHFFRTTIERGGDTARMSWGLAACLERKGAQREAEQLLRTAIERFPTAGMLRLQLANLLLMDGRAREAEHVLGQFAVSGSTTPEPWGIDLAWIRLRSREGQMAEALEITDRALLKHGEVWALERARIVLASKAGRPDQALSMLRRVVLRQPWNAPAISMLAQCQLEAGQLEAALSSYERLGKLDIRDQNARRHAARIRVTQASRL